MNRLVQEALDNDRFHPWVMRPSVSKVLIGLTAHNRFRKTWSNGESLRHGGNVRPSISGVLPLGQQLIINCEYVKKPRRNLFASTYMPCLGLIKEPGESFLIMSGPLSLSST